MLLPSNKRVIKVFLLVFMAYNFIQKIFTVSRVMTTGGDERIYLQPRTGFTYCNTAPCVVADVIERSSCSGSYMTPGAFAAVEQLLTRLDNAVHRKELFSVLMQQTHDQLLSLLISESYRNNVFCITASSVADSILAMLVCALNKAALLKSQGASGSVATIVVGGGELEQEVITALRLESFASQTPLGLVVQKNRMLPGIDSCAIVQEIVSVRTDLVGDGLALDVIERKVEALVEKAVVDDGRVAVLYFTQASLLGLSHLREEFIRGLQKKYGQWLVCLADMSQMRFCDGAVEHYLKYGWNVIVEASTFFQAPLFASALMVPVETVEGCGLRGPVPSFFEGLKNYLTLYDVDGRLQELRLFFNDICNEGLLARWTAGLVEMQRFYAFPEAFRNIVMQRWVYEVRNQIVQERFMFLLEDVFCGTEQPIAVSALAGVNTILVGIPMVLSDYGQWAPCPCDVLEAICMYAVQDISGLLPASASEEELLIAACRVLVGFPVSISREFGALRLALSASMVSDILVLPDAAREQAIQAMVCNDLQVLRKIALVIRYFFDIAQKNTLRSDQKMTR